MVSFDLFCFMLRLCFLFVFNFLGIYSFVHLLYPLSTFFSGQGSRNRISSQLRSVCNESHSSFFQFERVSISISACVIANGGCYWASKTRETISTTINVNAFWGPEQEL